MKEISVNDASLKKGTAELLVLAQLEHAASHSQPHPKTFAG